MCICVAGLSPQTPGTPGRRYALLIGNQSYAMAPLENPVNDANSMRAALEPLGFEVRVMTEQPAAEMQSAIDRWVAGFTPESVALFYFAGHGVQIDGENFLIPVDFDGRTEAEAKRTAINADWIRQRMEASPAILRLIILDACRTNPFRSRDAGNALAGMNTAAGTFIALSTGPGMRASDTGDTRNGLFTGYLVENLRQTGIELMDLFSQVRAQVVKVTEWRQVPRVDSGVVGKFYFRPPPGWIDPRFNRTQPGAAAEDSERARRERIAARDRRLALAKRLIQAGKFQDALADLRMAADADNRSVETLTLLATTQERLSLWEDSIATVTRALALAPDSAELYRLRGHALFESTRFVEAIADLSRSIDIAPDAMAYWLRSSARIRIGDLAGAEADRQAQRALRSRPAAEKRK